MRFMELSFLVLLLADCKICPVGNGLTTPVRGPPLSDRSVGGRQ